MVKRKFDDFLKGASKVNEVKHNDIDYNKNESNEFYYKIINKKEENIKNEFDIHFFEEASKAWKSNKITQENSTYIYKCTFRNNKKVRCNRTLYEYELLSKNKPLKTNCDLFCKVHINKKYNPNIHTFC